MSFGNSQLKVSAGAQLQPSPDPNAVPLPNTDDNYRFSESQLPLSVVSTTSGEAPGNLGWGVFPHEADYIIRAVGSGAGAVNTKTGNTDFSTSSGDHAPIFQQAIAASAADEASGNIGAKISFAGH